MCLCTRVSSANFPRMESKTASSRSLIKMMKSMGPRTEPWGTPLMKVTFDSVTGKLVQENLMIHFVEGFCVIKVDNITVVAFLEI